MRWFLLSLLLLAATSGSAQVPDDPAGVCPLLPGQTVPEGLSMTTIEGAEFALDDHLESPTILLFYRGGW